MAQGLRIPAGRSAPPIYLSFRDRDPFSPDNWLLAAILPADRMFVTASCSALPAWPRRANGVGAAACMRVSETKWLTRTSRLPPRSTVTTSSRIVWPSFLTWK